MSPSHRRLVTVLLTGSLLLPGLTASRAYAIIYRDKDGKIHISDTLPAGEGHTVVKPSKGGFVRDDSSAAKSQAVTATSPWGWRPVELPLAESPERAPKEASAVFTEANKSVWTVLAAQSAAHLEQGKNLLQGSAVAVSQDKMLTNCHVVKGRSYIIVRHAQTQARATVVAGDPATDRCILAVMEQKLQPIPGYRTFASLEVGEQVYTIGSPHGLENTLGQGIISGLREVQGHRFVQTTAQASPGSSGGGLFDLAGNLIGITTFKVQNSEGLNFAIAIEDFAK